MIRFLIATAQLAVIVALSACASRLTVERPVDLLADDKFLPLKTKITAADVFAVDDSMRKYLRANFVETITDSGARDTLVDALFNKGQLRLDYDAAVTRNASETFHARSGNCLSLTIMAAALARELGLTVFFQRIASEQSWGRRDDLHMTIGHVNLVVGERIASTRSRLGQNALHTIDFMRFEENHILSTQLISEQTILAMYMNNRAVEVLADGDADQAYWLVREALNHDPQFTASYITLGVIYRRHGDLPQAEAVLNHVLKREPANTLALSNLVTVLNDQGRQLEAKPWVQKLAAAQPYPPFYYFDLGRNAMQSGHYRVARDFFAQELYRSANNHEVHFWIASAYYRMGDFGRAKTHLDLAMDFSPTHKDRNLYAAKLEALQSPRAHQ
ncbi:MAG: tetratricopeptide repeat protein [Pseudomonadota bacterium]